LPGWGFGFPEEDDEDEEEEEEELCCCLARSMRLVSFGEDVFLDTLGAEAGVEFFFEEFCAEGHLFDGAGEGVAEGFFVEFFFEFFLLLSGGDLAGGVLFVFIEAEEVVEGRRGFFDGRGG